MPDMIPPQGMNLVIGPTGRGKSTLLGAMVRWRCEQEGADEKVVEYAPPVEYVHGGTAEASDVR